MIEFKTRNNLTIFLDLDAIFSIEQQKLDWIVRTKQNVNYHITEETALHIIGLARIKAYTREEEREDRILGEQIRESEEMKAPPHYAEEEDEDDPLEEWQKDPDDWNK